jgi:hypothetical protein
VLLRCSGRQLQQRAAAVETDDIVLQAFTEIGSVAGLCTLGDAAGLRHGTEQAQREEVDPTWIDERTRAGILRGLLKTRRGSAR